MSNASQIVFEPDAQALALAFEEQMEVLGAEPLRVYIEGGQLFARALLPGRFGEVLPGDAVRGGVAMRTRGADVFVHPFVYRVVCRNGQIQAHALETQHIARDGAGSFLASGDWVLVQVHDALRAAADPSAFQRALGELRGAARTPVEISDTELLLAMTSVLEAHPPLPRDQQESTRALVAAALADDRKALALAHGVPESLHRSYFRLMNVVTAVARETRDAELRWRLEEFGGAVGARLIAPQPTHGAGARAHQFNA